MIPDRAVTEHDPRPEVDSGDVATSDSSGLLKTGGALDWGLGVVTVSGSAESTWPPGHRIGRVTIQELLGSGGMGEVYRGVDEKLGRPVAIKRLRPERRRLSTLSRERMLREAQILSRIQHPGICQVFDLIEAEDADVIVMELVRGETLIAARERFTDHQRLKVAEDIAEALAAAHRQGVIHRDLKPDNVMVTLEGAVKVLDFGVAFSLSEAAPVAAAGAGPAGFDLIDTQTAIVPGARLTAHGMIIGTPMYMSPEQISGQELSTASDVYSLGIVLQEFLTGQPLYSREIGVAELIARISHGESDRPQGLDATLTRLIAEMKSPRPAARPSAADAAARIRKLRGRPARRRLVGAVVVAALLLGLPFAGLGLRAQFNARRQASMAQEFGQVVKEMQAVMRFGYLLPLHSVERERAIVKERMSWVEAQMQEVGGVGRGPGHYALGCGSIQLREYDRALEQFRTAWEGGYQEPEVAYSMGLVMGELYRAGLEEAERITDPKLRASRRQELERQYRDPAMGYLRRGETLRTESQEFAEGLLAYYEKDWERALERAGRASEKIPWLYEAQQLAGDVHMRRGRELFDRGDYTAAAADYQKAQERFTRAAEMGSSDARVHERNGQLHSAEMSLQITTGQDPEPAYSSAIEACERALVAHPQGGEPYDLMAYLHIQRARSLIDRGVDPEEELARSLSASAEASRRLPRRASAFNSAGLAWWLSAGYAMVQGQDPSGFLEKAIAAFDRALQLQPSHVQALNYKGNCYLYLGHAATEVGEDPQRYLLSAAETYRQAIKIQPDFMSPHTNLGLVLWELGGQAMNTGKDPRPAWHQAITSMKNAVAINPNNAYPHNSLGTTYGMMGSYAIAHGEDPGALLEKSIGSFAEAVRIKPDWPYPHHNSGCGYLDKARYAELMQQDPGPFLAQADAAFRRSLELNPQYGEAYLNLLSMHLIAARDAIEHRRSPAESLQQGRACFERALRIRGEDLDQLVQLAELELLTARWQAQRGASPGDAFERALRSASRAQELNPKSASPPRLLAECYHRRAEWCFSVKRAFTADAAEGLRAAEKSLSLNPDAADVYLTRGLLLLLQQRAAPLTADRARAAHDAVEALQKALEINRNLGRRHAAVLNDARALSEATVATAPQSLPTPGA